MEHLEMIISYEDLEKNRRKHLIADKKQEKKRKKQRMIDIIGITFFFLTIVLGVIGVNARFNQIYGNKKCTNEPTTQIVQNQNR